MRASPDDANAPNNRACTAQGRACDSAAAIGAAAVQDSVHREERRRRQIPRAFLVGLVVGGLAVAFRVVLDVFDRARGVVFAWAAASGVAWSVVIGVAWCAAGAAVAVALVRRYAPEAAGSGIPHVEAVMYGFRSMAWRRVVAVKFTGGASALGAGMALGREGPTVQMGAAVGQALARRLGATPREALALLAAGAGAGLAAAFNAPLAGVVFVVEELQRDFSPGVFTPAFIASVTADVVTRVASGQRPVFSVHVPAVPPLEALPVYCLIGLLAGLLGVAFNQGLLASLNLFDRTRRMPSLAVGGAVGALLGVVGAFAPSLLGDGHALIDDLLRDPSPFTTLAGLFAIRYAMTMVSYGCGAPGGIFAPLLLLGAVVGRGTGQGVALLQPSFGGFVESFAAVGMGAFFTGVVRAPLTGTVLLIEMTGQYALMLPLLVASLVAWFVADALGDRPIYEALLARGTPQVPPQPAALLAD